MPKKLPKLNTSLQAARRFLQGLHNDLESTSDPLGYDILFSQENEGTVMLSGVEAGEYRNCVSLLTSATGGGEVISKSAVERAFQRAIFAALDIRNQRSLGFEARATEAINDLKHTLTRELSPHLVFLPVSGLQVDGLPVNVGTVEFAPFGQEHLAMFRKAVERHQVSAEERDRRVRMLEEDVEEESLVGRTVGILEVSAIDWIAAEQRAFRELRLTADLINFFSDLLPYSHSHLRLTGEAEAARLISPQLRQG
jgi:hypothetical protein